MLNCESYIGVRALRSPSSVCEPEFVACGARSQRCHRQLESSHAHPSAFLPLFSCPTTTNTGGAASVSHQEDILHAVRDDPDLGPAHPQGQPQRPEADQKSVCREEQNNYPLPTSTRPPCILLIVFRLAPSVECNFISSLTRNTHASLARLQGLAPERSFLPLAHALHQTFDLFEPQADAIVYGMGSFYTSIMPSLILKGMGLAISELKGPKIMLVNGSWDRVRLSFFLARRKTDASLCTLC